MALIVGYNFIDTYDMVFHVGAGRISDVCANGLGVGRDDIRVQADGHELDHIKETFSGIPMCNGRVVQWGGDTAEFIIRNIKL